MCVLVSCVFVSEALRRGGVSVFSDGEFMFRLVNKRSKYTPHIYSYKLVDLLVL
jgi:hypothetical protein